MGLLLHAASITLLALIPVYLTVEKNLEIAVSLLGCGQLIYFLLLAQI